MERGPGDGACGCERCAGDCARGVHTRGEHVGAVHVVAQQLVAAHVALRGEPVQRGRAREGQRVRQQVRHGDRLSLEGRGPDLHAVQVQRARRLLHQPGDRASEGSEVQLGDSARRHREVQARRAPDALRGRAEEGAGDAHVVVVGRADVHHQVGGRAQPVPAAEGVASPRRQRVGAHDVPGEGAQGHGVALQLEASHRVSRSSALERSFITSVADADGGASGSSNTRPAATAASRVRTSWASWLAISTSSAVSAWSSINSKEVAEVAEEAIACSGLVRK